MPNVLPVQLMSRGGSNNLIVDVIVEVPAFQRNTEPGRTSPVIIDLTSGFQLGQRSMAASTFQTLSGGAAISISLAPATAAFGSIALAVIESSLTHSLLL